MDIPDIKDLVACPLDWCEVMVTPGWNHIYVFDVNAGLFLQDVTRVNIKLGIAWRCLKSDDQKRQLERSMPFEGNYRLLCTRETKTRFEREWEACM